MEKDERRKKIKKMFKIIFFVFCVFAIFRLGMVLAFQPSHERQWELGQEKLPKFTFLDGGTVTVENFRNFNWEEDGVAEPNYETRIFDLKKIETVDVFISHFDEFEGLAHIFISFGFRGGDYMVVSLETRREIGEEFSPFLGLLRQFEIIYVVGSEEDIVGLRTDLRNERVYVYPTKATPEIARKLFWIIANDINSVYEEPRIYNTLTKNCTNEITRRVEEITDVEFPLTWKTVLPGYFDEVLYEAGVINAEGDFSRVKESHRVVNEEMNRYDISFSKNLRKYGVKQEGLPQQKNENILKEE